jgi:hypothetical protein
MGHVFILADIRDITHTRQKLNDINLVSNLGIWIWGLGVWGSLYQANLKSAKNCTCRLAFLY